MDKFKLKNKGFFLGISVAAIVCGLCFQNCGSPTSINTTLGTPVAQNSCEGISTIGSPSISLSLGSEQIWQTYAQNVAWGYQYGPVDGTLGVLSLGNGNYKFYMSAQPFSPASGTYCGPSGSNGAFAGVTGTYNITGNLNGPVPTGTNASNCTPVVTKGSFAGNPSGAEPNGYVFDRDYAGGGPVINITDGTHSGVLHVYHGEYHSGANFYAALGMAVSTDSGNTFKKLGEIIQPYPAQAAIFTVPTNEGTGGGSMVIADVNGQPVSTTTANGRSQAYIYVFYSDDDSQDNSVAPCNVGHNACIAVARASYNAVVSSAFSLNTSALPALFNKYYKGTWSEPGTPQPQGSSGAINETANSGHYTAIISQVAQFPSVLWIGAKKQYLMAYGMGHLTIGFATSTNLITWSVLNTTIQDPGQNVVYPTLVGECTDPTQGGLNPYLFYLRATSWPTWSTVTNVIRPLQIN